VPPDLDAALSRFGHAAFRPGQRDAIETLLGVGRLLLVAPTGGGKSLTYQLPASLLPGTALVVSPLIALMQDQVDALDRCGVPATYLASTLDARESRERFRRIARGEVDLVYVAPERLAMDGFRALLGDLDVSLLAVDEAHCISEWGHDFRPEYLQIGEVAQQLSGARVLACTATATPVVRDEILARLGLPPDTPQLVRGFARPNLSLRAREVHGPRDRADAVDAALREALGAPAGGRGTAIVYAPTRRAAEQEAGRLAAAGWRARHYHAGLDGRVRSAVHAAFMEGELDVVVATNAFGMGIDRPDVRGVVHLGPPGSIEAYYQEVGRAGRDGERALGLLLFASTDLPLRRHLIESGADGAGPEPEVVEHKWNLFLELLRWAEGGSCRHDAILRYFGDEEETLAGCGICDACAELAEPGRDAADPEAVALVVRKALSAVARIHGRFGLGAAVALLRGERDERLLRDGLERTPTFGTLAERPRDWLARLLRRLVTAGWVDFSGGRRPVAVITAAGRAVMRGERPARVVLPAEPTPSRGAGARPEGRKGRRHDAELGPVERALVEALRAYRLEISRAEGRPPYVVAHDRTLVDLALLKPRTRDELLLAHGMGPARADRYGEGLLAVVRRHLAGAP
jgi:ATP-dependent DNA helicase RecQ